MANAVIMPKAGITVESCIIGSWQKKVGDAVKMGEVLFTYETDKASFECESTAEGELLEIYFGEGDEVPCLTNVCAVGQKGEDCSALRPDGAAAPAAAAPAAEAAPVAAAVPAAAPVVPTGPVAAAVIMPKAGITVESCIIGSWQKKVGDTVKMGEVLFTYETDKASFECESTAEGELLEIFFADGDEVPCMTNVCAIGKKGDDTASLRPGSASAAPAAAPAPAVAAAAASVPAAAPAAGASVSPRAKKLAETAGVDAALASGTGPNGRVIERDIRRLMEEGVPAAAPVAAAPVAAPAPAPAAAPVAAAPAAEAPEYEDVKFSGIRRAISKSMKGSLSSMAQLTHNFSFDATAILNYRKALKAAGGDLAGVTLGDIILFAVSRTILSCPDLNAHMLDDNNIRLFKNVNLGVAVDTPRGLMVPTIFHADEKSLLEISKELKELAAACRTGAISPDKLSGASFTVSNLGAFGVESFTPVINPPQTGIIGVCTTVDRPRKAADGSIQLYPAMGLSLTYDHRAVDGAPASRLMQELCRNLENFTTLLAK